MTSLFSIVFVCVGIYLFALGLRGLLSRRPFVTSARRLMIVLLLCYLPGLVNTFGLWSGPFGASFSVMPFLLVITYAVLLFVFWRQFNGYFAFGITEESCRDALVTALNHLQLPFQETVSRFHLTSLNVDLQVAVTGWMGTAQIRMKQRAQAVVMKQISDEMSQYFATTSVGTNQLSVIVYAILGLVMIGFGLLAR